LARGIEYLVDDDAERGRLSRAGVALILSDFTAERESAALLALYQRLIAERAGIAA